MFCYCLFVWGSHLTVWSRLMSDYVFRVAFSHWRALEFIYGAGDTTWVDMCKARIHPLDNKDYFSSRIYFQTSVSQNDLTINACRNDNNSGVFLLHVLSYALSWFTQKSCTIAAIDGTLVPYSLFNIKSDSDYWFKTNIPILLSWKVCVVLLLSSTAQIVPIVWLREIFSAKVHKRLWWVNIKSLPLI